MTSSQTVAQKLGEVRFRNKISRQHTGKTVHFKAEYQTAEMLSELEKRLEQTRLDMAKIKNKHALSPFLEIGAEYCVRSLALTNYFGAHGVAVDIARSSLEAAPFFAKGMHLRQLPRRICADAEQLPFADNSFAFVFCYQTLHHFPNPDLIVHEAHRVLVPGGYFFMAEEPVRQSFNLNFFRRPTKTQGLFKLLKIIPLLPFVSKIGKTETEHGILETAYPVATWLKSLMPFDKVSLTLESFGQKESFTQTDQFTPLPLSQMLKLRLFFLGGGISVLAHKRPLKGNHIGPYVRLACPQCQDSLGFLKMRSLKCSHCHTRYFCQNGVLQLLPKSLEKILYE